MLPRYPTIARPSSAKSEALLDVRLPHRGVHFFPSRGVTPITVPSSASPFGFSLGGGILSFGGTVCITGSTVKRDHASIHRFDDVLILSEVVC